MAKIKIKDLPKDMKIGKEEMRKVSGGGFFATIGQWMDDAISGAATRTADWIKDSAETWGDALDGSSSDSGGGSGVKPRKDHYESSTG